MNTCVKGITTIAFIEDYKIIKKILDYLEIDEFKRNRPPPQALAVNNTGIGPQGLGGKTTALACNIEFAPCHMATLPFSVFFGCHSTRRAGERIL